MKRRSIPAATRRAVIKRDGHTCQYCGKRAARVARNRARVYEEIEDFVYWAELDGSNWEGLLAFEFDHVIPVYAGGTNDESNLLLACRRCNRSKGRKVA